MLSGECDCDCCCVAATAAATAVLQTLILPLFPNCNEEDTIAL